MKFFDKRPANLDEHTAAARSRRIGVIGSIVIVVSLIAAGLLYLNPLGQRSYVAHMHNSGGVRPGDQIRIAGIPVGKVSSVGLDGTVVKMTFEVTRSLVLGSDSTVEVKLLTPLGGHYVALDPKGVIPLGDRVIPPEQTATPFEVNDVIQEATPLIQKVDGDVIHDTFSEIANAANKYPDALRNVIQTANELTTSLSQVTADYHRGLDFVNDYASAFVAGRQQLVILAEQFALVGTRLASKSVEIVQFFSLLSRTRPPDRPIAGVLPRRSRTRRGRHRRNLRHAVRQSRRDRRGGRRFGADPAHRLPDAQRQRRHHRRERPAHARPGRLRSQHHQAVLT